MRRTPTVTIAVALAAALATTPAIPLRAQDSAAARAETALRALEAMMRIPQRVDEMRRAGLPDSTVRGVLDVLKREKVSAVEAEEVLIATNDAAREHGPTDNFGAFVQARLASGLRGKELAAAIRAEHQARGKGRPADAGRGANAAAERGGKARDDAGAKGKAPDAGAKGKAPDGATKGKAPPDAGAKGKAPDVPTKGKAPEAAGNSRRPPR